MSAKARAGQCGRDLARHPHQLGHLLCCTTVHLQVRHFGSETNEQILKTFQRFVQVTFQVRKDAHGMKVDNRPASPRWLHLTSLARGHSHTWAITVIFLNLKYNFQKTTESTRAGSRTLNTASNKARLSSGGRLRSRPSVWDGLLIVPSWC